MDRIPITAAGLKVLEDELRQLKTVDRPAVIKAIGEAREHGDLSENAEYHAAREKQSFIEGRIKELEAVISHAEVHEVEGISGTTIRFGAFVHLVDEESEEEVRYQIVGEYESDITQGRLSLTAPIARALIGKSEGDSVEVHTPNGMRYYEVLRVSFG